MTWRGANEPSVVPWPEACRYLSTVPLKYLFITLFQSYLPLFSAICHANLDWSRAWFQKEEIAFPSLTPQMSFLWREKLERRKRRKLVNDRRNERGGRGLLLPAWAGKLVSEQQLDSGDAQHTLLTDCVCFCGVREIWSPPVYPTYIPHPSHHNRQEWKELRRQSPQSRYHWYFSNRNNKHKI